MKYPNSLLKSKVHTFHALIIFDSPKFFFMFLLKIVTLCFFFTFFWLILDSFLLRARAKQVIIHLAAMSRWRAESFLTPKTIASQRTTLCEEFSFFFHFRFQFQNLVTATTAKRGGGRAPRERVIIFCCCDFCMSLNSTLRLGLMIAGSCSPLCLLCRKKNELARCCSRFSIGKYSLYWISKEL